MRQIRTHHLNFCANSRPARIFSAGCYAEGRGACLQFCAVNPTYRRSGAAMDVRAGNGSELEMSAGCALQRGNLSADFGDYNASCANGTSSKPVARGRGKETFCTSPSNTKTHVSNDFSGPLGSLHASCGITWSPEGIKESLSNHYLSHPSFFMFLLHQNATRVRSFHFFIFKKLIFKLG